MAWNGSGNFQRTNGSFSGSAVWEDDANAGFDIVDSRHDTHDQDLAQGINNCLTKDGQNSPTADLNMNTFKHTNVGDGTARNHYATIGQLQDEGVRALSSVGGTANAITASMIPSISAYVTGAQYTFKAVSSNTGATTLKIGTGSALAVQWRGAALTGGEIAANAWHTVVYDGSLFQLLNPVDVTGPIWGGTTGGTSTAFTLTPTPSISTYATGQRISFIANAANGAAATLAVSGLTAKTIQRQGTALVGNEFKSGDVLEVEYDGTNFQLLNVVPAPLFIDRTNNRVGVSITAPEYTLDVDGSVRFSSPQTNAANKVGRFYARPYTNADGDWLAFDLRGFSAENIVGIGGGSSLAKCATKITFVTAANTTTVSGTERGAVTSAGNFLVNQSATATSADGTLAVTSIASSPSATFKQTNGTGSFVSLFWNNDTSGNNNLCQFLTETAGTARGSISYNRTSNVVAYNTTSDERLKQNITDAPSAFSFISNIQIRSFDWKETGNHVTYGAVAQELVTVAPQAVTPGDAGEEIEQTWGVDFSQLVPPTVRAVQELIEKIESIEARLQFLEA